MKALPQMHKDTLMSAFEEGLPSYIEYTQGRFLGVNTDAIPHLRCEATSGSWREGSIIRNSNVKEN